MKMMVICFVLVELEQLLILLCHVKHTKLGQCLQIRVANQREYLLLLLFYVLSSSIKTSMKYLLYHRIMETLTVEIIQIPKGLINFQNSYLCLKFEHFLKPIININIINKSQRYRLLANWH